MIETAAKAKPFLAEATPDPFARQRTVTARWYADNGYHIFPCKIEGKTPLTEHGFKEATTDIPTIIRWGKDFPGCNWGMACGPSGIVVLDIDPRHGGDATWEALKDEHPELLETVAVTTGGGGEHRWFRADPEHPTRNGTNALGAGIDVRADGGYVIIPPSRTAAAYTFKRSPLDAEVAPLPAWMLDRLNGRRPEAVAETVAETVTKPEGPTGDTVARAFSALAQLDIKRADDYDSWVQVGMSLRELGQLGLHLWDEWSQKSPKYRRGECAHKWETFTPGERGDITLGSLMHWAEADSGRTVVPYCPAKAKPSHYISALEAMGYKFSLNLMNDDIHVNGARQDDIIRSVLFTRLRENGYHSPAVAEDAWVAEASDNRFHPIRDYLNSLTWDGADHIAKLCGYIDEGKNAAFNTFFKRFLIGAVARPMAGIAGVQARAFVIDGPQGLGKSRFVRFLGSPLPQFYMESAINTEDKDFLIYLCSTWIWEVAELGSTMRKQDRDALKHFISRQTVKVRRAYGHNDIHKPAIAALCPTINNEAGFLWDPTGYRRYMVATVGGINWDYEKQVDINQVWAQATDLYRKGEPWELGKEENDKAELIAQDYEVTDPLIDYVLANYEINPAQALPGLESWFTATTDILSYLKSLGHIREAGRREAMQLGSVLLKMGCRRGRQRLPDGRQAAGHYGIRIRV